MWRRLTSFFSDFRHALVAKIQPNKVDIQSATAEIRQGRKRRRKKKKPQGKNIMSASAMQGGRNNE